MTITDERRLVTVLFADLVGFTGRAESSDPEQVRELQRSYFSTVAAEVERYGGSVEKYIGDAVMALFGAPQAHDDDAERAIRAALAIREGVAALDDGLEVRIGINTGEVVGGPGAAGGPQQGEYTVSGDAVNVAARLQQAAQPDEILVGAMTRRLAYEAFGFTPAATMTLKGRAEAVETWRVERALVERRRARGGEARLVGRRRELSALEGILEEARAGRGIMVALVGEPGIGKSRLALEIGRVAEVDGFAVAWTTSRSYASAVPYHLVGQLVPQLLPASDDGTAGALSAAGVDSDPATLDRWADALDDVLGTVSDARAGTEGASPAGKQRMVAQAVGALLRARSTTTPTLLVLDDLHWADPASLAVIEDLLEVLPNQRAALLATYRSNWSHGWEGRSAYEQLNLRPLGDEEARRMAAELATGAAIPADRTERVLERAAGNPLFLEELLHGEREAAAGVPHRLPASIHEMLLARLDGLAPEVRRTLQLASVVGMEFSEPTVADLGEADPEATADALRTLQRAELVQLRESGTGEPLYTFRHPLIHEVAYSSLLTSTRRALHGRVARWIEAHGGEDRVAELARHYEHSDDRDQARRYLRLAGERAHALNASREALEWFTAAAAAYDDDPDRRAEMLEAAAQEVHLLGEIGRAAELQREAIELHASAGNPRAAASARIWLGRFMWLLADPEESMRQNSLAIEGLEPHGPSSELAMAYSFRSQILMLIPDFEGGVEWARRAIEVAEATDATAALIHAYNNLGTSLIGSGEKAGVDYLRRSRDLALELGLADEVGRANNNLSNQGARMFPLPYADMDRHLVDATAFSARTIPDGIFDRWIRVARGEFLLVSGRWDEAEALLFGLNDRTAEAYLRGELLSQRAHLYAYRGRYDEAAAMTEGIADVARGVGDLQAVIPALVTQATIRFGLGDDAAALAALREAIERRGDITEHTLSAWLTFEAADGLTALAVRDPTATALPEGLRMLSEFCRRIARDVEQPGDLVQVEVRQALFGAAVEQLAHVARTATGGGVSVPEVPFPGRAAALAALDREHRRFDAARIRLWLAEEAGTPTPDLVDAIATFEELGALPYLERARRIGGA